MKHPKLTTSDLREIAHFHRLVLAYLKMKRIEQRAKDEELVNKH